jgi:PIN domain nuclease of toxin-antitoxin system
MKYLLDTHIFLWSLINDRRLKDSIKKILIDPENIIYVSVVSAWELGIKLKTNPGFKLKTTIKKAFTISGFEVLPISFEHVLQIQELSLYHKDPFDRMLICQAKVENLTLITSDEKIPRYKIKSLKA